MKRIAIIGGGISGLSAAYTLEKIRCQGVDVEYSLYESADRLGGVLVTDRVDDCIIEAGPDSFLTEKPWASNLCTEIGLGDQLIGSNDADRKTYILARGKLIEMPDGVMFMVPTKILPTVLSSLFSLKTKLRMAQEWFHPPHRANADETVASFVERHYGPEMVDLLADPLLSGVYGGEASQLSVRAVLSRFADMEAKHGSLGRAMLAARRNVPKPQNGSPRPLFTSLKEGMQQMVDALVGQLSGDSLNTRTAVQAISPEGGSWIVSAGLESDQFDGVILALPTQAAANLLGRANAHFASELRGITYSSSVTVALGYDKKVRDSLPPGFGFLVPRSEGRRMLAATFVHNKFPHRAPDDRALLRCFLGGARDEQILSLSDDEILRIVQGELSQIIRLNAEPLFTRVFKWRGAMAQYGVGHLERLQRIEGLRQQHAGLALAGNGYNGIGVPDCVRSGTEAVRTVLQALGVAEPQSLSTP
ncbi:MAG: protoporphyrinogen oxidase [Acidobacteria bacterium]|nr:MAG: protoporphyrinogen oxidase [Acidobacteriota bacterium]